MDSFQTVYLIELLFPLNSDSDKNSEKEAEFLELYKLDCDPYLSIGEEIDVSKSLGCIKEDNGIKTYSNEDFSFKAKVVGIKRENHSSEKTFLVRYFVESEDRDLIVKMCEHIKNNRDPIIEMGEHIKNIGL